MFIYDLTLLSTLFDTHLLVRKLRIIFEKHTRIRPKIDNRPTQIDILVHQEQHFRGKFMFAHILSQKDEEICSLLSFHVRPHQGVCDTPLHLFG